jgi:hypothetical protein
MGETGEPTPEQMGIKPEQKEVTKRLVERVLSLASSQEKMNKVMPELVDAILHVVEAGDPVALDAIDPDSVRNQKDLSPAARDHLRRNWEVASPHNDETGNTK